MEKFKDIELAIFDLDGTVVNLSVDWGILKSKLSSFVHEKTGEKVEFTPLNKTVEKYPSLRNELFVIIQRCELEKISEAALNEKTAALMKELASSGVKLAIFSTNMKETVKRALSKFNLENFFESIISREDVKNTKPDKEGIDLIMKQFNAPKEKTIYIGDKEADYDAAQRAGIKFLSVEDI